MKIVLFIYVFILALIVFLADYKGTRFLLDFVGNIPFGDKIGHFALMGGFSFVLNTAFNAKIVKFWKINFLLGSLVSAVIVALEEFSQIFVSGRTFDWSDLLFDFSGIYLFGKLARAFCRRSDNSIKDFAESS